MEHFECKWEIEQYIDQIALPRTYLGEVFFMESFPEKNGDMMLPAISGILEKTTRLRMLSVEDIGAISTVVFQKPEQYIGKKIDIAGDRRGTAQLRATRQEASAHEISDGA